MSSDTVSGEQASQTHAQLPNATVIAKYQRHENDCGSPEVQIALLTKRLETLADHAKRNPKDHHSARGMMRVISRRKQLLQYLKGYDGAKYKATISALGLRK